MLVFDPSLEWTGGSLVTTSLDLVRWGIALFGGKAIGRHYLNEMLNSVAVPERVADQPGQTYGYGLGVSIVHTRFGIAYRHGGFFPGYNSLLAYYPEFGIGVFNNIGVPVTHFAIYLVDFNIFLSRVFASLTHVFPVNLIQYRGPATIRVKTPMKVV